MRMQVLAQKAGHFAPEGIRAHTPNMLSKESRTKPFFATGILGGG